jgi:glycosyltransferase involved in cell wall biosynthesis
VTPRGREGERRRLLILTAVELTRDPRARRQVVSARRLGLEPVGLSLQLGGAPADLEGVEVHRVGSRGPTSYTSRARGAVTRELAGGYRALRLIARTAALVRRGHGLGQFDIVHANDFETLPAASLLARRSRARLIYDAHELYADFEPDPPRASSFALGRAEAALACRADAVVCVSAALAEELRVRLSLDRTPSVVLNAPWLSTTEPPLTPTENSVRAAYHGSLGPGRSFEDLLEAVRLAPATVLTVRIVGLASSELRGLVAAAGLEERVLIAEPVPQEEVVASLAGNDVGLVIDRPVTRNAELSLPNRLFEYLMAGLAPLVPRLPALAAIVDGDGLGATFTPGRPAELALRLRELAGDQARLTELRRRARAAAVTRYNAEAQEPVLAEAWGLK